MNGFSAATLRALQATKYMKIRCGDHRFIHVWVAVVGGRAARGRAQP